MTDIPTYDHEYTAGEETEWDLPDNVVPLAENDTYVKIGLIDDLPSQTVHAEKKALREKDWDSVEAFRADIDWEAYK